MRIREHVKMIKKLIEDLQDFEQENLLKALDEISDLIETIKELNNN